LRAAAGAGIKLLACFAKRARRRPVPAMADLKLIALDAEDLSVVSAHLQDAVLRVGDMTYLPSEKRFAALANRFDWDKALASTKQPAKPRRSSTGLERRRTGLRIERVLSAKVSGIDLKDRRATFALLTVSFSPSGDPESPDGDVTLTFSGGAAIRLKVECLEFEMKDLGAVWSTKTTPAHPDDDV
jgi:Protein of unknown function (DUF2948)